MNITHIVLHYSATYDDQDIGVREIDIMHRARGFSKVGYHYVIRLDGTVEVGRKETEVGAHVKGQNTGKIGICCVGGLRRKTGTDLGVDTRAPAQVESQIRLIRDLLTRYPKAKVVGHRDLASTQCPGFDVIPWWSAIEKGNKPPEPKPPKEGAPTETLLPFLKLGSKGVAVAHLQAGLRKLGFLKEGAEWGTFDKVTYEGVVNFQESQFGAGKANGMVGTTTWAQIVLQGGLS